MLCVCVKVFMSVCVCVRSVCTHTLTSTYFGADSQSEWGTLGKLFSEALAHVVIDVVGTQQLLEGFGRVTQVLREDVADAPPLSHLLPQVRQLSCLCLDQCVVLPVQTGGIFWCFARCFNTSAQKYMLRVLHCLLLHLLWTHRADHLYSAAAEDQEELINRCS